MPKKASELRIHCTFLEGFSSRVSLTNIYEVEIR